MPDLSQAYSMLIAVLGIGFLILAHEFGHFLVAKWCGVRVEVFSVGFGKALYSKTIGDTEYRLALVFIGGYVKMAGDPMSDHFTGAPDELQSKSATQRVLIYGAGPLASALAGIGLFWLALQFGILSGLPRIGYVEPDSPAAIGGLLPGDELISIDGTPLHRWEQFEIDIAIGGKGPRHLTVKREEELVELTLHPVVDEKNRMITRIHAAPESTMIMGELRDSPIDLVLRGGDKITHIAGTRVYHSDGMRIRIEEFIQENPDAETVDTTFVREGTTLTEQVPLLYDRMMGVRFAVDSNLIEEVIEDKPADILLGLQIGDAILSVDGHPITKRNDLFYYLHLQSKDDYEFTWRRGEETFTKTIPLITDTRSLPFAFGREQWVFRQGPVAALSTACYESVSVWKQIKLFFSKLFSKDAKEATKGLGGPIGIFNITYRLAQQGYGDLFFILAMISVNLAIVNILPIPLLDGGQVMFIVLEKLKGSPLNPRSQDLALYVGLFIILSLFLFATLNDLKMLSLGR